MTLTQIPTWQDLQGEAVRALTAAARLRRPDGTPIDFADFMAQATATAAANVGGAERLLAGRSGSWEADLVAALVSGTMQNEPDEWRRRRTDTVEVSLNVAEIVEERLSLIGLDQALTEVENRHAELTGAAYDPEAYEREYQATTLHYTRSYAHYAALFADAVQVKSRTIDGLTAPVVVKANADPLSAWWRPETIANPVKYEADDLAWCLWAAAFEAVSAPSTSTRQ